MKIEVELEERYKLTFENSSMCMGQYYSEVFESFQIFHFVILFFTTNIFFDIF